MMIINGKLRVCLLKSLERMGSNSSKMRKAERHRKYNFFGCRYNKLRVNIPILVRNNYMP